MTSEETRKQIHELDVTVWVGKNGVSAVISELEAQLEHQEYVKVKFHRAARSGSETEDVAKELAEQTRTTLIETRGHTAVYRE